MHKLRHAKEGKYWNKFGLVKFISGCYIKSSRECFFWKTQLTQHRQNKNILQLYYHFLRGVKKTRFMILTKTFALCAVKGPS